MWSSLPRRAIKAIPRRRFSSAPALAPSSDFAEPDFADPKIHTDEEYYIYQCLRWMLQSKPPVVVHVENVSLTGCQFLPGPAARTVSEAPIVIHCLTHCGKVSDRVLWRQIQLIEETYKSREQPVGIFALNLTPGIQAYNLKSVRDAMMGAAKLVDRNQVLVCGLPNSGKTSLVIPITKQYSVLSKNKILPPLINKPYEEAFLGMQKHTLKAGKYGDIVVVNSPGLRPRMQNLDARALSLLLASRALDVFEGYKDVVGDKLLLATSLAALNRHADASQDTPIYVEKLGLSDITEDPEEFYDAVCKREGRTIDEQDLITDIYKGFYGGQLFWAGKPSLPADVPATPYWPFSRDTAVIYMNEQAKRFAAIGTGEATYTPMTLTEDASRPNHHQDKEESGFATGESPLPGEPIVYPEHRADFDCMTCAGFVKRDKEGRIFGCRFTRAQQWTDIDIVCFYSRMMEAFGGLKYGHVRYLFKDSLACTLAMKHKLRSRAQAYKKVPIVHRFPIPDHERPFRFRVDQPIQLRFSCKRALTHKHSCVDPENENDERHPVHFPNLVRKQKNKRSHSTARKALIAERGEAAIPKGLHYRSSGALKSW